MSQLKQEYELLVERAIEEYKEAVARAELLGIGDEAVSRLAREPSLALTELRLCEEVDRIVFERLRLPSFRAWRAKRELKIEKLQPICGPHGEAIAAASEKPVPVLVLADEVSDDLIAALARSPDLMYHLGPRKFEALVADVLSRHGAEVTLTPTTRDGGRDVIAKIRSPIGIFLCLIECKRYAPDRPVGVRAVRELYGVVAQEQITSGMLVTTSRFTEPARTFAERVPHRLYLKAFHDLAAWLHVAKASFQPRRPNVQWS